MPAREIINKTMDLDDLNRQDALPIIAELNSLVRRLAACDLRISSWMGRFDLAGDPNSYERINRGYGYRSIQGAADDINFPWFKYWEIVWLVVNNCFRPNEKVLDLGGSSSLFSYYLASKGVDVTTIDIQEESVKNANLVAQQMGWSLRNQVMDMRKLTFPSRFDHVTSVDVLHTLPVSDRIAVARTIKDFLVDHGRLSITFDYRNPSKFRRLNSPKDLYEQFVEPSGLKLRGNPDFLDNGKSYLLHPFYYRKTLWRYKVYCTALGLFNASDFFARKESNDYTFGALFLERAPSERSNVGT